MIKTYRVLHLIKGLGRGGAERLLADGARHVNRTKFTYEYAYFLPWKNAFVPELEASGAEVTCFNRHNSGTIILSAFSVARFCKQQQIDLMHCHLPVAGIVGRLAGKIAGIPVVYTEHNLMQRYHPVTRIMNVRTWNWQSAVIAVSHGVAASIQSHVKSSVPVRVIQNGVPAQSLLRSTQDRSRVRLQLGIPGGAPVIGTVAVFRIQKNLPDWIRAARIIKDSIPECHFLLVGDGPLRSEVERQIHSAGLSEAIHLSGLQENVAPYYSAMDLYMSSSIFEGLPIALLEAMAMNLPVLATSVGGVPEIIDNEVTGFLVEPARPELLAASAISLLRNEALRNRIGFAARSVIESRFNISKMTAQLEMLYTEIFSKRQIGSGDSTENLIELSSG
jgi:L-malate glycosyltransferase